MEHPKSVEEIRRILLEQIDALRQKGCKKKFRSRVLGAMVAEKQHKKISSDFPKRSDAFSQTVVVHLADGFWSEKA